MNESQARKLGARLAVRCLVIIWLAVESVVFFKEVQGDFANGILFYLDARLKWPFWCGGVLLIGLCYIFGQKAGEKIAIRKWGFLLTGCLFALATLVFLALYGLLVMAIKILPNSSTGIAWIPITFELNLFYWPLIVFLSWIIAAWLIRDKAIELQQP